MEARAEHAQSPLSRLWTLLKSERRDLWTVVIYAIGVGILSLATPIAVMAVVNTTALSTLTQQLIVLCLGLMAALVIAAVLRLLQTFVVEYLQQRVFVNVVNDLSYRLPRIDVRALDREHGPELVNRFFDVITVQKSAATLLLDGITVILQTLIGLILLGSYHQWLLGFDLFLICSFIVLVLLGIGATATAIEESRAKYSVANWLEEIARHPVAFKLGGGPGYARQRADLLTQHYLESRQRHFHIVMRQFGFALFMQAVTSVLLLVIGGYLVIQGQLSLGQLVAAELVVSLMVGTFTKWGKQLESYYDLLAAVHKLGHLLDLPLERESGESSPHTSKGTHVQFRDVAFQYERNQNFVLQQFNENFESGARVALMGRNGAGKTTLLELLFGLRDPTKGHILIDGVDLRDLQLEDYRWHSALVKGIEIFSGNVVENVRMGRSSISTEEVRHALRAVCLLDDILELPDGLQTNLGTGGNPLSLGQAERLMLARAIVAKPSLLILDESLDDMDQSMRQLLVPALFDKQAPWTLIVVTHSEEISKLCTRVIHLKSSKSLSHH
jgi:putative ABC transport system ATP-binding protein